MLHAKLEAGDCLCSWLPSKILVGAGWETTPSKRNTRWCNSDKPERNFVELQNRFESGTGYKELLRGRRVGRAPWPKVEFGPPMWEQ